MPNYVKAIVRVYGAKADKLAIKALVKSEIRDFDFNKIIPTPDDIFQGPVGEEERKKYGKNNWYDWDLSNWGTKWNAFCITAHEGGSRYDFQTAWSFPLPVLKELSKRFPKAKIVCRYADEDIGRNCGTVTLIGGMEETVFPSEETAKAFAHKVWRKNG